MALRAQGEGASAQSNFDNDSRKLDGRNIDWRFSSSLERNGFMNDWVPLALQQPERLEVSAILPANSIRWMLNNWDTLNLGRLGWKREQFVKALNSMNEPRYAWSEVPGEVVLMPHHMREGENYRLLLPIAKDLHSQLGKAIEQAEQTPFLRWWIGLSVKSIDGSSRYISQESNVSLTKDEAEALFNQIREAK